MVGHKYTEAEHNFLHSFVPGHTYKEIVEAYNKHFDEPITLSRVKGYIANHKLNTGKTGRFEKGQIPFNKGKKGMCAPGCEKTWFKKGNMPHNSKPIGYERITKDGYIEVKVFDRPDREKGIKNFVPKHRLVWEQIYGPIPKGCKIFFLDGNRQNCDIENLALVTEAEHLEMTRRCLRNDNPQFTKTGVLIAKSVIATRKAKRKDV